MSVYVDDMRAPFGRMIMCHMMADSREELDAMADAVGVARKWIQHPDSPSEHYDIALAMRAKAVKLGAKEITLREIAAFQLKRAEKWRKLGRPMPYEHPVGAA